MKSFSDSYKAAGVDVTAGYKAVELMKQHMARTDDPRRALRHWAALAACLNWIFPAWSTRCWFRAPTAWAPS